MDSKIKKLISELDIGSLKSFSWLESGYVSHAYQIDTTLGSYVLLEQKKGSSDDAAYKYHYAVLKCLENKNYAYAPKAIYVGEDGQSLLMKKSPGVQAHKLSGLSLTDKKTISTNIVESLLALQVVKRKDLAKTLKPFGLEVPKTMDDEKAWQKYAIDTFYPYQDSAPKDTHAQWLAEQIESYTPEATKPTEIYFVHGDPGGSNILVDKDFNVTLIDWSLADFFKFDTGKEDFELSYALNHVAIMNELQDYVLEYTAKKQNIDPSTLRKTVYDRRKGIKICDICWAFKMYTKASIGEAADKPEVYKRVLDTRIKEYKKEFA